MKVANTENKIIAFDKIDCELISVSVQILARV